MYKSDRKGAGQSHACSDVKQLGSEGDKHQAATALMMAIPAAEKRGGALQNLLAISMHGLTCLGITC